MVCRTLRQPRSTVYARRRRTTTTPPARTLRKRGPKTAISDAELLEAIRLDIQESPFVSEGHRKIWARLKRKKLAAGKARVLKIMRENNLLSPHRSRCAPEPHDNTIVTDAPNLMWGTDGTQVQTVLDGTIHIFAVIEHWNAECLGFHLAQKADRFAALEPIKQAVRAIYGSLESNIASGLALRLDHGTQYTSHDFQAQIKSWGMRPSFAFVRQPETNGVSERFMRTYKEQVCYGNIFQTKEELYEATRKFIETYNREWRLEKLGFQSPLEYRHAHSGKPLDEKAA